MLLDELTDGDLLSFFRIAYLSTYKWQMIDENSTMVEKMVFFERGEEIYRSTLWMLDCEIDEEPPAQIPQEVVMGPVLMIRLLTRLVQRGLLERAQTWTALPEGCDQSTSLAQVKQITSSAVIKKLLTLSVKRVTARREIGLSRLPDGDHRYTRSSFPPGAELAHVLVQFDEATKGQFAESIRGARKELALCLDLAAEMSMKIRQYESALGFSLGAVAAVEICPRTEGIPTDLLSKNKRRITDAKRHVRA